MSYSPWGHRESDMTEQLSTEQHAGSSPPTRDRTGAPCIEWGILATELPGKSQVSCAESPRELVFLAVTEANEI